MHIKESSPLKLGVNSGQITKIEPKVKPIIV